MKSDKSNANLFVPDIDGPTMHQSARSQYLDSPRDAAARDRRDPVVVQAIANVAAQQPEEEWWAMAPGVRTHAIYDEIRRLDRVCANDSAAPIKDDARSPRYQMA
jgi:hypothetical protein